jgi:hypothetical protein
MFSRLLMSFQKRGASEGKPHFFTQALGIPWVALVFLTLRYFLVPESGLQAWHYQDFVLLCCCVAVYAVDFLFDSLRWDELTYPIKEWQVNWALFWGLFAILGLLLVALLMGGPFNDFYVELGTFRWTIFGGVGYVIVRVLGRRISALLGPFFIAMTFAFALFWDRAFPLSDLQWWGGFLLFLTNVILMQWMEQDKDAVSSSTNVWLELNAIALKGFLLLLSASQLGIWGMQDHQNYGPLMALVVYGAIWFFPKWFRPFRLYRLLIDGALVLWLI